MYDGIPYQVEQRASDRSITAENMENMEKSQRELLDTVKARKLANSGHTMRKQGSCLEKEIMQGTVPSACRRGRPRTAWMDNIKTWTGLSVEESIRMTEVRESASVVWPTLGSMTAKEQKGEVRVRVRYWLAGVRDGGFRRQTFLFRWGRGGGE